ncbi:MAG TPA: condensation domain-containing protein, partial [Bacilli bacterium]|nr:condensation domain-containing protein [Bacilli bacterium]
PGERMYKTGDRGYFRADGAIMFLGRLDDQVKVRGQRVELGEIEAVLATHSAIQNCAVVAHKGPNGYNLTAYYLLNGETSASDVTQVELRAYLGERLPEYMVPRRFIQMDAMPTTVSGKIDRMQLPEPNDDRPELEADYLAPTSVVEVTVAGIWQEILGVLQVGTQDNFFELGGHSLDATRIISRVNKELGLTLPLKTLFETPTVSGIAAAADKALQQGVTTEDKPIPRLPKQEYYELSNAQKRIWFQYNFDADHGVGFTFPTLLKGEVRLDLLERAFQAVVKRHGMMRTTFTEIDGVPYQVVHEEMPIPSSFDDLTHLREDEQKKHLAQEITRLWMQPYDLETGPLFRLTMYKLAEQEHLLLFSLHHIAYDGWSSNVMFRDLSLLYQAYLQEEEPQWPEPLQYVEFAAWQNDRLASGQLDAQLAYWEQQLSGDVTAPLLPYDFDTPPAKLDPNTVQEHTIGPELTRKLRELAQQEGTTLYVAALTGFKVWLSQTTGAKDVTVGVPTSGRVHRDLEDVLGLLVNPVVMRTDFWGNPSFRQALERVNRTALEAYANQEVPFDLILNGLRKQRADAGNLYSVVFVGQNAHGDAQEFAQEVTVQDVSLETFTQHVDREAVTIDDPSWQFDMHIEMYEGEDRLFFRTQFDPRRFKRETIADFLRRYESVLEQCVNDPELRLSKLEAEALEDMLDDLF